MPQSPIASTFSLPRLIPAEIWLMIFRSAMELDDSVTEIPVLDLGHPLVLHETRAGLGAWRALTRRSIPFVSREWNVIATSLLYEHVVAYTPTQHDQLLRTLEESGAHGQSNSGFGRCVKRLDLWMPSRSEGVILERAVKLLEKMPALVTLSLQTYSDIKDALPVLSAIPPRRRNLCWMGHCAPSKLSLADLRLFFESHPLLSTVSLPFHFPPPHDAVSPTTSTLTSTSNPWEAIEQWSFQNTSQIIALTAELPAGTFPNLKTVRIDYTKESSDSCLNALHTFLSVHGQNLTCISVPEAFDLRPIRSSAFPSLREVEVKFDALPALLDWFACEYQIDKVETLRIRLMWFSGETYESGRKRYSRVHTLHSIVGMRWAKFFPRLKTIRIMEEVDIEEYRKEEEVTLRLVNGSGRWLKRAVVVEDVRGRILGEFTKGVSQWVGR